MKKDGSQAVVVEHLSRLENIQTRWSLLRGLGPSGDATRAEARQALILRYASPIRAYILAIVKNEDEADELAQDAVVRLLQGDFAGADPERGRFRDLLKTALRNMVRNHWKRKSVRKSEPLDPQFSDEAGDADDPWLNAWRRHLLDLAWADLQQIETTQSGRMPYQVLKLRIDHPDDSSSDLAARLTAQTGNEIRPDAFRQQLKRARQRFAEVLLRELIDGLEDPTPERVHDEVIALGLYEWMRDRLDEI